MTKLSVYNIKLHNNFVRNGPRKQVDDGFNIKN